MMVDGGAGKIVTERTARGVNAFIYDNAGLLVLLLLLLNVGLWNAILQHRTDKSLQPNACQPKADQVPD